MNGHYRIPNFDRHIRQGLKQTRMRKLIAAINMTIDGYCDHTEVLADDALHQHYNELLKHADTILFGRVTYNLMESSWPGVVKHPTGNQPMDEFALLIQDISKIVFSHTLKNIDWKNAKLAKGSIQEEVLKLREQAGKDILVGSPSLIVTLTNLNLIDEYQLCIQPIITGKGLPLFKKVNNRMDLSLLKTKTFNSGSIVLCYEPKKNCPPTGNLEHI